VRGECMEKFDWSFIIKWFVCIIGLFLIFFIKEWGGLNVYYDSAPKEFGEALEEVVMHPFRFFGLTIVFGTIFAYKWQKSENKKKEI